MKHDYRILKVFLVLCCVITMMASASWAQLYSGSVTGVITDPSGGVVPGAKVTLTDIGKQLPYTAITDPAGRYLIRSLPPSTYKMTVEMSKFNTYLQDNIVLAVNQNLTIDVTLKLGSEAQTVEVSAAVAALATQDAVTGQELNRVFINDLPLLGRGVYDLAFLTPGVHQIIGGSGANLGGVVIGNTAQPIGNNFVSDGGRNSTADILLDGVSVTNNEQNSGVQIPIYTPSVEAVQEFKVQQSNFSAEIGFSGGTVVNMVTRSGTNAFHGNAYEFVRNNIFTANDWFSNAGGGTLPARRYNLFGATVGGPIKKDKTFFFIDFEGTRDISAVALTAGVPSQAMKQGDFGEICGPGFDANGKCTDPEGQLWDPYTGVYNADEGGPVRSGYIPFNNLAEYVSPGNPKLDDTGYQLAANKGNLIDPVAAKMIQYFPNPNLSVGQPGYNRFDNWLGGGSNTYSNNQFDIKIDHSLSDKSRLSGRYSHNQGPNTMANGFGNPLDSNAWPPTVNSTNVFALNHTYTLSSNTVFTTSLGFARNFFHRGDILEGSDVDPVTTLGLPEYIRRSGFKASPAVGMDNYKSSSGYNNIGSQRWSIYNEGTETYHLIQTFSQIRGRHDLKIGGEGRMHRINFVQPCCGAGLFDYSPYSTSEHPYSGGGDSMAGFLTGVGGSWGEYEVPAFVSTQSFQFAGFLQDNLRVNDRLTLNMGIRYDLELPRTERYNRMSFVDPEAVSPVKAPGFENLKGALGFVDNSNRYNWGYSKDNLGPRFGFAYRLSQKTVMRGGYGLFYTPTMRANAGTGGGGSQGFTRVTNWFTTYQNDLATPWGRLSDPWPITGPLLPTGSSEGAWTDVGNSIGGPMRSITITPYEQTWSFGFQRELRGGIVLDANYVGKKGTHLFFGGSGELDQLGPEIEKYSLDQISALNTYVPNPFYGIVPKGSGLDAPTVQQFQLLRPYPQFTDVAAASFPAASAIYHAFQLRVEKRFSRGLQFLVTYTNAKSIDDASLPNGGVAWLGGTTSLQDPNNYKLERSLSQFDIPQVLGINYVYELPVGKGKALGRAWNPWVDTFLGGWKTSAIWRFSSGQPLSLGLADGQSLPTYGAQRPNLTGALEKTTNADFIDQYFANPGVVVKPAPFAIGNAPRTVGTVRTPGINNSNMSLFKEFAVNKLREGAQIEYRAEFFNAFNHPRFCGPNTTLDSGNFGQIQAMCGPSREVQMALKLYW